MTSKRKASLSPLILIPSFLESNSKVEAAMVERCGLLCSVKNYPLAKAIAEKIDSPVGRLYETIASNDYNNPESFIIENVSDKYMSRVFLSIAISYRARGDLLSARGFLDRACRYSEKNKDAVTLYQCKRELAIIHSIDGNHKGALELLGKIFPLIRYLYRIRPAYYFDYLNSLAVELGETGETTEALKLSRIALASPFSGQYHSWHATYAELTEQAYHTTRSLICLGRKQMLNNVLPVGENERPVEEVPAFQDKKVLLMEEWLQARMKDSRKQKRPVEDDASLDELEKEIHHLIIDTNLTRDQLRRIRDIIKEGEQPNVRDN